LTILKTSHVHRLTIGSIYRPYSFIFRHSIALVQGNQTALRNTDRLINRKNQEGFLAFSSVFSESARHFNTEYLTFLHHDLIKCDTNLNSSFINLERLSKVWDTSLLCMNYKTREEEPSILFRQNYICDAKLWSRILNFLHLFINSSLICARMRKPRTVTKLYTFSSAKCYLPLRKNGNVIGR
jgi:hypothetical protein